MTLDCLSGRRRADDGRPRRFAQRCCGQTSWIRVRTIWGCGRVS